MRRCRDCCFVAGQIVVGRFLEATTENWERVKRANLDKVFHALQAALPPMVVARRGQIVVFTSATGARPEPMVSLYSSTRAGAKALIRAVGLEHAKDGVTVNAIGTNYMDFPGFLRASGATDLARRNQIESQVPQRRLGRWKNWRNSRPSCLTAGPDSRRASSFRTAAAGVLKRSRRPSRGGGAP